MKMWGMLIKFLNRLLLVSYCFTVPAMNKLQKIID